MIDDYRLLGDISLHTIHSVHLTQYPLDGGRTALTTSKQEVKIRESETLTSLSNENQTHSRFFPRIYHVSKQTSSQPGTYHVIPTLKRVTAIVRVSLSTEDFFDDPEDVARRATFLKF